MDEAGYTRIPCMLLWLLGILCGRTAGYSSNNMRDGPYTLAGVEYTARAEQTPHGLLWKKGGKDEFTVIVIDPVEKTCTREGSVRASRCTPELMLRHAVGLAIESVLNLTNALILTGVSRTIHFAPKPPATRDYYSAVVQED
jgi:hypothetical protein